MRKFIVEIATKKIGHIGFITITLLLETDYEQTKIDGSLFPITRGIEDTTASCIRDLSNSNLIQAIKGNVHIKFFEYAKKFLDADEVLDSHQQFVLCD